MLEEKKIDEVEEVEETEEVEVEEEKESVGQKADKVLEDGKEVVNSLFSMHKKGDVLLPKLLEVFAKILYIASVIIVLFSFGNLRFGFGLFLTGFINAVISAATIFATGLILQAIVRILRAVEK